MVHLRKLTAIITQVALVTAFAFSSVADAKSNGREAITQEDLKEWLTYLASDELEGRNTFTEGLGLAAGYIAERLRSWGVKPGGPNGSYLQRVAVLGVKSENNSTITVEANGQTRTFKNKEGVNFPTNVGGKRVLTSDQIEFVGYGINAPLAKHNDYEGKNVKGKVVVFLGSTPPKGLEGTQYRRALFGRSRYATDQGGAVASIGVGGNFGRGGAGQQGAGQQQGARGQGQGQTPGEGASPGAGAFGGGQTDGVDFTTVQRLDAMIPPAATAQDELFEFLFSGADVKYAELKEKASKGEPLPAFTLKNVRVTFNIDAKYQVIRTQYTHNVVGIIEGTDPKLKETYVAFGAHYDHVGYAEGEPGQSANAPRGLRPPGRVTAGAQNDRIWNGADDDGSGTVTILGIAKAFATGAKPKRSLVFVWHSGEERGLWGSRYFADYPTVPMDKMVAQINMDMVGRNRDDKTEEANTVYIVGSDRISTEFHNVTVDANAVLAKPLKLDYEMNDPTDLEQIYYRSDHYSYAAKGVPIVFLTTGLHPDYHTNTDSVEKINFEKMARIGQYAYEVGMRTANMDHPPARDNRGPRVGKGNAGKLPL
ncbi:MAG TPA: M28 family peptidase [Blastocatellia bacterium]|nr:M28 family peptidase [Blastocatellia bacterium]